jgi:hypothetical protein
MIDKKSTLIRKKVANLKVKVGLLVWQVLLPFGLYWSLMRDNTPLSILFAVGILLGMLILVVFG